MSSVAVSSTPVHESGVLIFPPFYQRRQPKRFKRVVPEELLSQFVLQIRNGERLFGNSARFFEDTREVEFRREGAKEGVRAQPRTTPADVLSILH